MTVNLALICINYVHIAMHIFLCMYTFHCMGSKIFFLFFKDFIKFKQHVSFIDLNNLHGDNWKTTTQQGRFSKFIHKAVIIMGGVIIDPHLDLV